MRLHIVLLAGALLSACGGKDSPPPASPDGASAAPDGPCLAFSSKTRPKAANDEVGSLTVHLSADPAGCTFDLRARDGAKRAAPACDVKHSVESIGKAACALGGDFAWMTAPDSAPSSAVVEMKVGRFSKPDPRADLALICTPFASLVDPSTGRPVDMPDADPSQKARIRASILDETLTSRQWRQWLRDYPGDRTKGVATLRDAARAASQECSIELLDAR